MSGSKKVLVLGAGLVVSPGVRYLSDAGFEVVVASRTLSKAEEIVKKCGPNASAVALDAADPADAEKLDTLIAGCDLVVSLLPWTMHTPIAKLAVKHKVHFGSTSYISDEMQAMDEEFKANGKVGVTRLLKSTARMSTTPSLPEYPFKLA